MSRTVGFVECPIPSELPGKSTITVVSSVRAIFDPEVSGDSINFACGPCFIGRGGQERNVHFLPQGSPVPEGTRKQNCTVELEGKKWEIFFDHGGTE